MITESDEGVIEEVLARLDGKTIYPPLYVGDVVSLVDGWIYSGSWKWAARHPKPGDIGVVWYVQKITGSTAPNCEAMQTIQITIPEIGKFATYRYSLKLEKNSSSTVIKLREVIK